MQLWIKITIPVVVLIILAFVVLVFSGVFRECEDCDFGQPTCKKRGGFCTDNIEDCTDNPNLVAVSGMCSEDKICCI